MHSQDDVQYIHDKHIKLELNVTISFEVLYEKLRFPVEEGGNFGIE